MNYEFRWNLCQEDLGAILKTSGMTVCDIPYAKILTNYHKHNLYLSEHGGWQTDLRKQIRKAEDIKFIIEEL